MTHARTLFGDFLSNMYWRIVRCSSDRCMGCNAIGEVREKDVLRAGLTRVRRNVGGWMLLETGAVPPVDIEVGGPHGLDAVSDGEDLLLDPWVFDSRGVRVHTVHPKVHRQPNDALVHRL
jgi:hypothetical protein